MPSQRMSPTLQKRSGVFWSILARKRGVGLTIFNSIMMAHYARIANWIWRPSSRILPSVIGGSGIEEIDRLVEKFAWYAQRLTHPRSFGGRSQGPAAARGAFAISQADRIGYAGSIGVIPKGSEGDELLARGWRILHVVGLTATMQFYCSAVSMTSAMQKPKSSP
jgi:hypothetical protein